ncbi:pentapeptide repeat-containing protein [Amycolatopsis sp. NPDC023774]|uniref:pentapeptide repeat-containing protein n=1 Tax=Amycolatopsis sp. NPDC023774 TaxID=3155015 RepID=UPI003402D559
MLPRPGSTAPSRATKIVTDGGVRNDFTDAGLERADFTNAHLEGTDFTGARMSQAGSRSASPANYEVTA